MVNTKEITITKERIQELKQELQKLIDYDRVEVIAEIKAAREQGDLSENADYEAARYRQGLIESRITEIEGQLRHAKEVKISHGKKTKIKIGDKVKLIRKDNNKEVEYHILGPLESDPFRNIISNDSPVGKALIGRKVGEVVTVKNNKFKFKLEIKEIS